MIRSDVIIVSTVMVLMASILIIFFTLTRHTKKMLCGATASVHSCKSITFRAKSIKSDHARVFHNLMHMVDGDGSFAHRNQPTLGSGKVIARARTCWDKGQYIMNATISNLIVGSAPATQNSTTPKTSKKCRIVTLKGNLKSNRDRMFRVLRQMIDSNKIPSGNQTIGSGRVTMQARICLIKKQFIMHAAIKGLVVSAGTVRPITNAVKPTNPDPTEPEPDVVDTTNAPTTINASTMTKKTKSGISYMEQADHLCTHTGLFDKTNNFLKTVDDALDRCRSYKLADDATCYGVAQHQQSGVIVGCTKADGIPTSGWTTLHIVN